MYRVCESSHSVVDVSKVNGVHKVVCVMVSVCIVWSEPSVGCGVTVLWCYADCDEIGWAVERVSIESTQKV